MNVDAILTQLKAESTRLNRAIEALEGISRDGASRPVAFHRKRKRVMSAAARKRIGLAKKSWWAERKKKASK